MGRRSSIAGGLWQSEVERAILDHRPVRQIARAYDLSPSAVARHRTKMLREAAAELLKEEQADRQPSLPRRPRRPPGRPSTIANHSERAAIRSRMLQWEAHRNREPGGIVVRPWSPHRIARRYGVSVRSLKRWWAAECRSVLDRIGPPPPSATSKATRAVERLAQTFRDPDRPLPAGFEAVEIRLRDLVEAAAQDLPPEDRSLLTALAAATCCILHAALCDADRLTERHQALQEAMIMGYVRSYADLPN